MATTINHRLSDIRRFCRYLCKKNVITPDEYEAIREINDANDDNVIDIIGLSASDVCLILKSVDGNRDVARDHFLLSLLYESGARINELLLLRFLDIRETSSGEADVHFYGKDKKHRITPLSKEIRVQFDRYREKYHQNITPDLIHLHSNLFRRTRAMHLYQIVVPLPTIFE